MKTLLALMLCATTLFGQKIELIPIAYETTGGGNIVDFFGLTENMALSNGVVIKFSVAKSYKNTYIHSAYVYRNGELIPIDGMYFITKKDTISFISKNTLALYGEDLLMPTAKIGVLKNHSINEVVIVPRDTVIGDIYCNMISKNYFKRFLPLVPYNN